MTRSSNKTVIFWGAGATATLGMRATLDQGKFIRRLAGTDGAPLFERIRTALDKSAVEPWLSALGDLLTILGDVGEQETPCAAVTLDQMGAMRHNWRPGADDNELRGRVMALRALYDWPALKAIVNVCPGVAEGDLNISDLFNVLDMHGLSGHGFRRNQDEFLTPQQVLGARNALKMLLQAMFFIDYQQCLETKRTDLARHYAFAEALGRRMQRQGLALAGNTAFDSRDFYLGDVSFSSLNYDPIALWCQFVANRNLNQSLNVPHVGCPVAKLQIFHDLGHFVAGTRVKKASDNTPWHPMNESSAQRLNDADHGANVRIRISKFLFPHGCLCWRECPDCGKLSSYLGDSWDWASPTLIPPPPLNAFVREGMFCRRRAHEAEAWAKGEVDARACVHCGTLTYAHHTQTLMQSNFKSAPPSFIDEIQRDLRVAVQHADHIIFMGYSLPQDDVTYRAFFAARRRRYKNGENPVKCSVVTGYGHGSLWHGPSNLPLLLDRIKQDDSLHKTIRAAIDIFGKDNVRFYGGGIPTVFLDGAGTVTESVLEQLLTWERM